MITNIKYHAFHLQIDVLVDESHINSLSSFFSHKKLEAFG